jgi:two-component system OmpR family sensor kinase
VSKGRLTRQELGWLLTQEAQGAAERLRTGMAALTLPPQAPDVSASGPDPGVVGETLSALDDTMKMLSSLHAQPTAMRGRRGRIDVASLLWEVAPEARVSIEPGSGTEVFGDEAELRRMLHVMLGHGSGTGSTVAIRREGDEVVVRVVLGPDSSATADTERAWLSRMAIRYGGRYELEGGTEVLALPAEGVESRDDLARLRKELDEARAQGATYARELAAVWTTGGEETGVSTTRPPSDPSTAQGRYGALTRLAGGVAATLRGMLSPVGRDLSELRSTLSPRKSSPDLETVARMGLDERLEGIRRKLLAVQDFVAELATVGESDLEEAPRPHDLVSLVKNELKALEARASRAGVDVLLRIVPDDPDAPALAHVAPRAASLLVRELGLHALAASPRGSRVLVTLHAPTVEIGARILVDDSGTILPAGARDALVALQVEPGTFGRPSTIALFVAAEVALSQGALIEIGDAPVEEGNGGGVRVSVTFPR